MKKLKFLLLVFTMALFVQPFFVHADNSVLISLKTQIQTVISDQTASSKYENDSYQAFIDELDRIGGLSYIDEMMNSTTATDEEISSLASQLETMLSWLTTNQTYNTVNQYYFSEKAKDLSSYTQRSSLLFYAELNRIKDIIDNPTSGEILINAQYSDITEASTLLQLLGNSAELEEKNQQALAVIQDGSSYIPSTLQLFQSDYQTIDNSLGTSIGMTLLELINYEDASASEIDLAMDLVNHALAFLVDKPDKTLFSSLYLQAVSVSDSLYTPNSYSLYTTKLDELSYVLSDDEITSEILQNKIIELESAKDLLVLKADKSNLSLLNNEAIIAYYEEKVLYTNSSYDLYKEAVIEYGTYLYVNQVINDDNALQSEVDALSTKIQNALNLLVLIYNNSNLLKQYNEYKNLDLSSYTPNSVSIFNEELEKLYLVITGNELSESVANTVQQSLDSIQNILVNQADRTNLQQLYDSALRYDEEDYSASSFAFLQESMEQSQLLISDKNASQETLDLQYISLLLSIRTLKPFVKEVVIYENQQIDIMEYITLGNSTLVSVSSSNAEAASVSSTGELIANSFGRSTITVTLSNGVQEHISVLVKATLKPGTIALAVIIPIISVGAASMLLFYRKNMLNHLLTGRKK